MNTSEKNSKRGLTGGTLVLFIVLLILILMTLVALFGIKEVGAAPNEPEAPSCHGWLYVVECHTNCHTATMQIYGDPSWGIVEAYFIINGVKYNGMYVQYNWTGMGQITVYWFIRWSNGYTDDGTEIIMRRDYCPTGVTSVSVTTKLEGIPVTWPLELTYKGENSTFSTEDGEYFLIFDDATPGEVFTVTNTLPHGILGPTIESRIIGLNEQDIEFLMFYENKTFLPIVRK